MQCSAKHLNSCKECRKAYQRGRPHDREYERQRNQTEERKAHLHANLKRWRRENPHKMAVQLARRRARKLNAEGDFTVEEFGALFERYGKRCLRCGRGDVLLTPDHVVPLSLGDCNSWKNVKTVDYRPDAIPGAGSKRAGDSPSGSLLLPAKTGENGV